LRGSSVVPDGIEGVSEDDTVADKVKVVGRGAEEGEIVDIGPEALGSWSGLVLGAGQALIDGVPVDRGDRLLRF
jgi:hypothetical protein